MMIEIVSLTKKFGDVVAVDGITLTVAAGEVLALLGPNGAGKTTTVRMLSSILQPTAGRARVAGFDVATEGDQVRRHVGVLTEAPGLYTRMTGREYLDFFGQLRGLDRAYRNRRIATLTAQFQVGPVLDRRLAGYSKGMRQKIALVRTLLHDPPVLLFDEPTSAMDPQSARLVRDAIHQLRDDAQRAIIICTHNLPEAEELSDCIAIIHQGHIRAHGSSRELKARWLGPPMMELRLRNGAEPYTAANSSGDAWAVTGSDHVAALGERALALMEPLVTVEEVNGSCIRYRTSDPSAVNPQLLRALSEADIPVVTLSEVPRRLEHVYLQVMHGEGMMHDPAT